MSKAKRTPRKPRTKLDENERNLRMLVLFVQEAVGFRLGIVTYDTPRTRDTQLDRLTEFVAPCPVYLTRLDLSKTPDEKLLLTRLQEHLRNNPAPEGKTLAVMVVNLEAALDYRMLVPDAREGLAILTNANFQRDAYPKLCPVPVVIWLNPTVTTTFARKAPDLWDWRSATFHFTGPPDERQQWERIQVAMPLIESDQFPRERKRERIALLRDLLVELENGDDRDTRGSKARRATLLSELGLTYAGLSEPNRAIEYLESALRLSREIGDRHSEEITLGNLGLAYAELSRVEEAIGYYEQALAIAREIGDRRGEGNALGNLGMVYKNLDRVEEAIVCYEQALAIAHKIGNRRGEGNTLGNLGVAYAHSNRVEEAITYYERALTIDHDIGNRRGEGATLVNLGLAYAHQGRLEQAIGCYEQALAIARAIGNRRGEANALGNLGLACTALGQVEQAIGYHEKQVMIARDIGDRRGEGTGLCHLGIAYVAMGQKKEAINVLSQSLRIAQEIKDPRIIRVASAFLERLRGDGND
jgi:tetratricopeptide (TPR) repeat protein